MKIPGSRILVTGASGFIGSSLCSELAKLGAVVQTLVRPGNPDNPTGLGPNVKSCLGVIQDEEAIGEFVARSDFVFHLAGLVGPGNCDGDIHGAIQNNVTGTLSVLQAMRTYKVPGVFLSVANVRDGSVYSITKATAERFCLMFNKEHRTKMAVCRLTNVYGPGQNLNSGKLIVSNISKAKKSQPLSLFGTGEQKLDFLYIDDAVSGLVELLSTHAKLDFSKPIVIGSGVYHSVKNVLETIVDVTKSNSKIEFLPKRHGDLMTSIGLLENEDATPIKVEKTNLRTGIARCIEAGA